VEQGRVAVCHAFGFPFKKTLDPLPPFGVYSIPEVAMAGISEEEAKARGVDYEVGRGRFSDNTRAMIGGSTEGMVKLVFDPRNRLLLGVHVLGDDAAELVHHGQAVLHHHGTIDHFIDSTYNIPTRTEAYKYAAYDGLQNLQRNRARVAVR
jgi:NAD(P) transhydrogenase